MKVTTELRAVFMDINPKTAKEMLAHNVGNREPSQITIDSYARQMPHNWFTSADAIAFSKDGRLVNGQQRLMAVEKSGSTIKKQLVVFGLDTNVFGILDCQRTRSLSVRTNLDKSITEIANGYWKLILKKQTKISANEAIGLVHNRQIHFDSIIPMRPKKKGVGAAPVWVALIYYAEYNLPSAMDFARQFVAGYCESQQVQILRNWIYTFENEGGTKRRETILRRALYCMNAHAKDIQIKRIGNIDVQEAFA